MHRLALAVPLSLVALVACSAAPDEGARSSEGALCVTCGKGPSPAPSPTPVPIPTPINVCNSYSITSFGAGPQIGGDSNAANAVYGDPLYLHYAGADGPLVLQSGQSGPVTFDGQTVQGVVDVDGLMHAGLFEPVFTASSPLTHTVSLGGACNVHRTITVTPHQATAPVYQMDVTWPNPSLGGPASFYVAPVLQASTCAAFTTVVAMSPLPAGKTSNPVSSTNWGAWEQFTQPTTVTVTGTCTAHPEVAPRVTTYHVWPTAPAPVAIKSFAPSATYAYANSKIGFSWSTVIPNCLQPVVSLEGFSQSGRGLAFLKEGLPLQGSLSWTVTDDVKFQLTALCRDDGRSATSGWIEITPYNPGPSLSTYCFEVTCKTAGCTTIAALATDEGAAQSLFQTDPTYGGCSVDSIDCGEMASACPDPFAE